MKVLPIGTRVYYIPFGTPDPKKLGIVTGIENYKGAKITGDYLVYVQWIDIPGTCKNWNYLLGIYRKSTYVEI